MKSYENEVGKIQEMLSRLASDVADAEYAGDKDSLFIQLTEAAVDAGEVCVKLENLCDKILASLNKDEKTS